jgi:tRNA-binding protein
VASSFAPGVRPPILWPDFDKVDMRVGLVVDAQAFPEARRPAYKLWIDFGPLGVKRSSAQITRHYQLDGLVGRRVVAVVNFPPKQIGPFVSEVLVLGAHDEAGEVILLEPDHAVGPGARIG